MSKRATLIAGVLAAAALSAPASAEPAEWRKIDPNPTWGPARALHDLEATGPAEAWIAGYQGAVLGSSRIASTRATAATGTLT